MAGHWKHSDVGSSSSAQLAWWHLGILVRHGGIRLVTRDGWLQCHGLAWRHVAALSANSEMSGCS